MMTWQDFSIFRSKLKYVLVKTHRYLPPTLQEVADIIVSFRHQMERFPNDLLLHVLRLRHVTQWNIAVGTWCEFCSHTNHIDTQPLLILLVFILTFLGWFSIESLCRRDNYLEKNTWQINNIYQHWRRPPSDPCARLTSDCLEMIKVARLELKSDQNLVESCCWYILGKKLLQISLTTTWGRHDCARLLGGCSVVSGLAV